MSKIKDHIIQQQEQGNDLLTNDPQEPVIPVTYTPGPWFVTEPNGVGNGFSIQSGNPGTRMPDLWVGVALREPEQRANVKLIAAAPDLLELLLEGTEGFHTMNEWEAWQERVKAVTDSIPH